MIVLFDEAIFLLDFFKKSLRSVLWSYFLQEYNGKRVHHKVTIIYN